MLCLKLLENRQQAEMVEATKLPLQPGLPSDNYGIWENILGMRIIRAAALDLRWTPERLYLGSPSSSNMIPHRHAKWLEGKHLLEHHFPQPPQSCSNTSLSWAFPSEGACRVTGCTAACWYSSRQSWGLAREEGKNSLKMLWAQKVSAMFLWKAEQVEKHSDEDKRVW